VLDNRDAANISPLGQRIENVPQQQLPIAVNFSGVVRRKKPVVQAEIG
jgi:hypothetical protein